MTAVNISGTFAKDERPMNGLEGIADQLVADEFGTHYVIGRVKPHGYNKKPGEPMTPVVKFEHIEVVTGEFDEEWVNEKLDELYRARKGREAGPANPLPSPGQIEGQTTIDDASGRQTPTPTADLDVMLRYSEAAGWVVGPPGGAGFATTGDDIPADDVEAARLWATDETLTAHGVEVVRWVESLDQDGAWVAMLADDGPAAVDGDEGPVSSKTPDVWLDDK